MESDNQTIKTAFLSSLITLIIIIGIGYIARGSIVDYLQLRLISGVTTDQTESLSGVNDLVVTTIDRVNPAVVSVVVTKDVPIYERYYENYGPGGFWGSFSIPRVREKGTEEREIGGGSGFIVSDDGVIVTNRHVVDDGEARYSVLLNDGTSYGVEVLARDPDLDIAILKINEPLKGTLSHLTFGDSENLKLGQTVIAIGNALAEFRNSVSVGVVSGLLRTIVASDGQGTSEQLEQVIQTDAAINPGNSGGPLLNLRGEVIGVNVATSQGADNISFALPANAVKLVVDSVRETGEIVRPFLGVRYTMITPTMAESDNLPVTYGALIIKGEKAEDVPVAPDSPAAAIGLAEGDIILSIDGVELRGRDLATVLRGKKVGQEIELKVIKQGEEQIIKVTLTKMV